MRGFKSYDFGNLLRQKYDIQQQEADARTIGAQRQFVGGMPSPSNVMSLGGMGTLGGGAGGGAIDDPNADLQRSLLETQIADAQAATMERKAGIGLNRRKMLLAEQGFTFDKRVAEQTGSALNPFTDDEAEAIDKNNRGQKKGTAVVRPKGVGLKAALKASGKKDTIPAKLATGEAVLNKSAADMLGRGMIAKLNAKGAAKMGMI